MKEIEETRELIAALVQASPVMAVPLADACGRILAEAVLAPMDFPAFDHSAMDGYALSSDSSGPHIIVGEVAAGGAATCTLLPGQAMRIFTGAPVPQGTLCVIRQEDCAASDGKVSAEVLLQPGDNIRRRGAVFCLGQELMPPGTRLTAGAIGLLASCGCSKVHVRGPIRVLHIVTGTELVSPSDPLGPGKIYDSNGPMISALLAGRGIRCESLRIADDAGLLERTVAEFSGDLLLISGGSGPGDYDFTTDALEKNGYRLHVTRVNSRPGKPMLFATKGRQAAFGLPGNPLSHWVCFHVFVAGALAAFEGLRPAGLVSAKCENWLSHAGDGRRTWTPAVHTFEDTRLVVSPLAWQHSGDLLPLARATAIVLDEPDPTNGTIAALLLE